MKDLNSLYFVDLSAPEQFALQDKIRNMRRARFRTALARISSDEVASKLGPRRAALHGILEDLDWIASFEPGLLHDLVGHWSTTFLFDRLLLAETESALDETVAAIEGSILSARLSAVSFGRDACYQTIAARGWTLFWPREERWQVAAKTERVRWHITSDLIRVETSGGQAQFSRSSIRNCYMIAPLPQVSVWGLPVVEEPGLRPSHSGASCNGWLPVADSLNGAQEILTHLWPGVDLWVQALVPAFVDTGLPPSDQAHTSGTSGPGSPIFVSQVRDEFLHAEDVVHELQHLRIKALLPPDAYPNWNDSSVHFVSPWRPDPRHIRGVFLGVHASLAINRLRLRALEINTGPKSLDRSVVRRHCLNLFAFHTLCRHFEVCQRGRSLFTAMAAEIVAQHNQIVIKGKQELRRAAETALSGHVEAVQSAATEPLLNTANVYQDWDLTLELAKSYAQEACYAN